MPWDDPVLTGSALPTTTNTNPANATGNGIFQSSLADALARFDSQVASSSSSSTSAAAANDPLRRRRFDRASTLGNAFDSANINTAGTAGAEEARVATVEDRLAQHRQSRIQRLADLRRERNVMRSLLGGPSGAGSPPSPTFAAPVGGDVAAAAAAAGEEEGAAGSSSPRSRRFAGFLWALAPGGGAGGGRGFTIFDFFFFEGRAGGRFGFGGGVMGDYMVRLPLISPVPKKAR
jgi:hypothetical protein